MICAESGLGIHSEPWDPLNRTLDVIDGDEPRAFELTRCVLVARTPHEVLVIETQLRIVPAAVAGVIVHHAIGGGEFVERMSEAGDHDHRRSHRPGEPGKSARKA